MPKKIVLWGEHLGESCFNKSADLGRRLEAQRQIWDILQWVSPVGVSLQEQF